MSMPHQRWLVVYFLSLDQAQFDTSPTTELEGLSWNADYPTGMKQIGYRLEPVASWIIDKFALRFEGRVCRTFQTRFRIGDKSAEGDLFLLPFLSNEPSIDSIHNESEIRSVPRDVAVPRIHLDSQRRYHGRIYFCRQFESLLARNARASLQVSARSLEWRHSASFGLSSLPVISNGLLQILALVLFFFGAQFFCLEAI